MPASPVSPAERPFPQPAYASPPAKRPWGLSPSGLWPAQVVAILLVAWLGWILAIFNHPLSKSDVGSLQYAINHSDVEAWAAVEHVPQGHTLNVVSGLRDPIQATWELGDVSSILNNPQSEPALLAWRDMNGTHVADLSQDYTIGDDGSGTPHPALRKLIADLPTSHRVTDIRHLWADSRLMPPPYVMTGLHVLGAVLLLWRVPRFRTRRGWFWILCTPLGLGFVWMLVREHIFGVEGASTAGRTGGWTGLITLMVLTFLASTMLGGVIPT